MLHFPDRDYPRFRISLRLTFDELCKAAAVGGYFIPSDHYPDHHYRMKRCALVGGLTVDYARIGLRRGLHQAFEMEYPTRLSDEDAAMLTGLPMFFSDRSDWEGG